MIEELLNKPYWVLDFLPEQVPEGSAGQFFAVERFFLQQAQQGTLRRKFSEVVLKLNCYVDVQLCGPEGEGGLRNPAPEQLAAWIADSQRDVCMLLPDEDTLLTVSRDDLCMVVYNPSEKVLKLLERLAAGAGLYLWQPPRREGQP